MVNLVGKIKGSLNVQTLKTVAFVVIGAVASGILAAFLPIHPILSKLIMAVGLGIINPMLAVGGFTALILDFLGGMPKPGKTEGSEESEAV